MRMEEVSGTMGLSRAGEKTINMYNALCELVHLNCCEQEGLESGMPTPEQWEQAVGAAHRALKNYKGDNNEGI